MPDKQSLLSGFEAADPAEWRELVEQQLKGAPFDKKLVTRTPEGIALQPIYGKADTPIGVPGRCPFLRGVSADGSREPPWEVCQELLYEDPKQFNKALLDALNKGQHAVSLNVARNAPKITCAEDLKAALDSVDVSLAPLHVHAGLDTKAVAGLLSDSGLAKGMEGSLGMDPLGWLAARGSLPVSIESLYDDMKSLLDWSAREAPAVNVATVSTLPYMEAGASAVEELAVMLATGAATIRALVERGAALESAAATIRIELGIGSNVFMEIAKFRTARKLWADMSRAFGLPDNACKASIHASTLRLNKTRRDPHVNMLRTTTEAFSAVVGGCEGITLMPFDELTAVSNVFSDRIARNQHTVLAEEAHLTDTVDPAGGSWYIESISEDLGRKAWELFQEIEGKGGMLAVLKEGFIQDRIHAIAADRQNRLAQRRDVLVGINRYVNQDEQHAPFPGPAGDATDGETKVSIPALKPFRLAESYEQLMNAVLGGNGPRPTVFMANFGALAAYKARCDFVVEFLKPSGFNIIEDQSFDSVDDAVSAIQKAGAACAVVCSTDDVYPELVPAFAGALKEQCPGITLYMAGMLIEHESAFRDAGVDEFIHLKSSNLELLLDLHKRAGVKS